MAHGGLLDIRRDDAHVAESRGDFGEAGNTGAVNTIVVADKDARFHSLMKRIWMRFWPNRVLRLADGRKFLHSRARATMALTVFYALEDPLKISAL